LTTQQINWDRFTGQWLATVRALKRDPNYCRLARAMASADDHYHNWEHYLYLAQTWKGIHEDRNHASMQTRCDALRAKGWVISVRPGGIWFAEATGIEGAERRLADLLAWMERSGQPLREEWERSYQLYNAKREAAKHG